METVLSGGILHSAHSCVYSDIALKLYFYSHPELLRWLQGIVVSHVIGVHDGSNGQKSVFMEAPHHIFWHTAHPGLSIGEKQAIIQAYETLHAHGILHNNIDAHNICIGQ